MKWAGLIAATALALVGCTVRRPGPLVCFACTYNQAQPTTTTTLAGSWK